MFDEVKPLLASYSMYGVKGRPAPPAEAMGSWASSTHIEDRPIAANASDRAIRHSVMKTVPNHL